VDPEMARLAAATAAAGSAGQRDIDAGRRAVEQARKAAALAKQREEALAAQFDPPAAELIVPVDD